MAFGDGHTFEGGRRVVFINIVVCGCQIVVGNCANALEEWEDM